MNVIRSILWLSATTISLSSLPSFANSTQNAQTNDSITVSARRLTESEYRNSIADIFGPEIKVNARFEPEKREGGLLAIGNSLLSMTSAGFEQYFNAAGEIAQQVFDKQDSKSLAGCAPKTPETFDKACAQKFLSQYGEKIFRRPLSQAEINARLDVVNEGTKRNKSFNDGLKLSLASLLASPDFLFRMERAEPDPANQGEYRLDAYTKAQRLSFLFWNTTPDEELLTAARNGSLHTDATLSAQLDRLAASDRFNEGARAFFIDMFQLDGFENMVKDPTIYPKFNQLVADSAKEQMIKTTLDLLVKKERDYRTLFSSNETFINRPLASIYNVPYASAEEWMPYTFKDNAERAGILSQVAFLSQHAHAGTSSPTRRGIKIHEIFMCEPTPDPPADVDFSKVRDSKKGTVRGRLLDHMENTGCTACHRRSDPPGLALEHFDGIGQLRKYENGALIDVSADFNGHQFVGAEGLANYLQEDKRVPACLVRNVYAYGTGRAPDFWDEDYLADQTDAFAEHGYRVPELVKQIAKSPEFFTVHMPEGVAALEDKNPSATATAQVAH